MHTYPKKITILLSTIFSLSTAFPVIAVEKKSKLDPVVVSANRRPLLVSQTSSDAEIIYPDANSTTISDSLKKSAGLTSISQGAPGALEFTSFRGLSGERTLTLLNGFKMNDPDLGSIDLSLFAPFMFEKIEIIKGSASSLYSGNGTSGIINLVTKPAIGVGSVLLEAGSFGYATAVFGYNLNLLGHSSQIKIFSQRSDNQFSFKTFEKATEPEPGKTLERQNAGYTKYGAILTGELINNKASKLDYLILYSFKDLDTPGQFVTSTNAVYTGRQKDDLTSIQSKYIYNTENGYKYKIGLKVSHHALEYFSSFGTSLNKKQISTIYALFENKTNSRLRIQTGIENQYDRIYNNSFEAKNMDTGFLGDIHLIINNDLSLMSSMRYDINSDQKNTFSIKGGIIAKLPGEIKIKGNISSSIKNPTINQLYYPEDAFSVGNTDLISEKGIYADIILSKKFGKNLNIKTAFFYYEIKDMIIWDFNMTSFKYQPINKDTVKISGLEVTAAFFLEPLILKLAYTYNPTELVNDGKAGISRLPYTPLHKVNANADLKIGNAVISTSIDYLDVYYTTTANSSKLSDVFLLNLGVNIYLSESYRMGASLNNILNKNYQFFEGYPMPGFNFKIYVKMEL